MATIREGGESLKRSCTNDKTDLIKFRVSPEYKAEVVKQARQAGFSISDYLRQAVEKLEEPPKPEKEYRIKNPLRAGTSVYGITGKPIGFDEEGIAIVSKAEFEHFLKVPGYSEDVPIGSSSKMKIEL